MASKLIESAQGWWRAVNGPQLDSPLREGGRYRYQRSLAFSLQAGHCTLQLTEEDPGVSRLGL